MVASDGTQLPRAALGAYKEPVWAIETFFGFLAQNHPIYAACKASMPIFSAKFQILGDVYEVQLQNRNFEPKIVQIGPITIF